MEDEIFGPLLPIRSIDSLDEAIEILSEVEKPLAMYMFTRNEEAVEEFLSRTRSGAVTINDVVLHITGKFSFFASQFSNFTCLVDTLPFGGVGNSGFGSYHGKFGFEQFSHKRAVLKRGFFGEGLGRLI
jgi:aldehyde dehydrogenase (NAD+)